MGIPSMKWPFYCHKALFKLAKISSTLGSSKLCFLWFEPVFSLDLCLLISCHLSKCRVNITCADNLPSTFFLLLFIVFPTLYHVLEHQPGFPWLYLSQSEMLCLCDNLFIMCFLQFECRPNKDWNIISHFN
jgi:hypothetical protein